jgi:hypothetical protein
MSQRFTVVWSPELEAGYAESGAIRMTTLVLDEVTRKTTLGELLEFASDRVVEVRHEDGTLVATVVLSRDDAGVDYDRLVAEAERDIDELRRRANDPRPALSTLEFIAALERL